MNKTIKVRHSAWFGDKDLYLKIPNNWDLDIYNPIERSLMDRNSIIDKIEKLITSLDFSSKPSERKIAVVIDDLSRPTPVEAVLIPLLEKLEFQGVKRLNIAIFIALGTHPAMNEALVKKKLGTQVYASYKVIVHDPNRNIAYLGKTQNNTSIFINKFILEYDLKIGIGGVFPHSPAGFGGGSKLILGILGFKSIAYLHYNFKGSELGGSIVNDFRNELVEIAEKIGFEHSISIIINENREIINLFMGNIHSSYKDAVQFVRDGFKVKAPGNADLVIINTYPFDSTLLFSKKGWWPAQLSKENSINIVIGSFSLGVGGHGLHPLTRSKLEYIIKKIHLLTKLPAKNIINMFLNFFALNPEDAKSIPAVKKKYLYFRPENNSQISSKYGYTFENKWEDVIDKVNHQFQGKQLKAVYYSCSSLQLPA